MADKIANSNFFKNKVKRDSSVTGTAEQAEKTIPAPPVSQDPSDTIYVPQKTVDTSISIDGGIKNILDELDKFLLSSGQKNLLTETARIRSELQRQRFTVAVVGEFNKGKSTFINHLLQREILPVGNLPTTAMLTKLRYSRNEMMIKFSRKGEKQKTLPLKLESWDGMTVNFTGNEPEGTVIVGVDSPWLRSTGICIEDTPGAGDLDEKRAELLGEALRRDDGAIIAISATAALSMSEKLFIEQRLISPKTPYIMLIITKLDLVSMDERSDVIRYIKDKLSYWKWNIPVYVPEDIEMPDDTYSSVVGMDKVKAELSKWVQDPRRKELTLAWLKQQTTGIINMASASLDEQKKLIDADDDKRRELIEERKMKLSQASLEWERLRRDMEERNAECYRDLVELVDENKLKITEKLQFEAYHANNPEKWWKNDYPYRMKVELMNLSGILDNFVNRRITEDIRWFNTVLNNQFKSNDSAPISRIDKTAVEGIELDDNIKFDNINAQRNIFRVGTAVATVAGYVALAHLGVLPIIATFGISTGSGIISETVFKVRLEKQQREIAGVIAKNVPEIIDKATLQTERNLKAKYNEIIQQASRQENVWMSLQKSAIENSVNSAPAEQSKKIMQKKAELQNIMNKLHR